MVPPPFLSLQASSTIAPGLRSAIPSHGRPAVARGHRPPRFPLYPTISRRVLCAAANEYRADSLTTKTVAQLRQICEQLELEPEGKKADLVQRICLATSTEQLADNSEQEYAKLTVKELRSILQQRELPVPSRKQDMIAKILESEGGNNNDAALQKESNYSSLKVGELKRIAKERGLPVPAKKADVIAMLTADDKGELNFSEAQARPRRRRKQKEDAESIINTTEGRVVLSSKTRDTSRFTRAQQKQYQQTQDDWSSALQASSRVVVNEGKNPEPITEAVKASMPSEPQLPPQTRANANIPEVLTHYLVSLMDNTQKKTVATLIHNYIKSSMQEANKAKNSKSPQIVDLNERVKNIDVRAMQRTKFVKNEVTGNTETEQVHYEHGDLLVSCYMTQDIAEYIYSLPGSFRNPGKMHRGKPAWAPESKELPCPLTIEQYTDAQQFFIKDIGGESSADMLDDNDDSRPILVTDEDFEQERLRRMLLKIAKRDMLEAKIEVSMGKPAKYTSPYQIHGAQYLLKKDAMSRESRSVNAEPENEFARALDGGQTFSTPQRMADSFSGGEIPARDGRKQKYAEDQFWEEEADDGWYTGGDIAEAQEVNENLRFDGMTNDGRNVYVSKGNTWAPGTDDWLDDPLDDSAGQRALTSRDSKWNEDNRGPAKGNGSTDDFMSWLDESGPEDNSLFEIAPIEAEGQGIQVNMQGSKGAHEAYAEFPGDVADVGNSFPEGPGTMETVPPHLVPGMPVEVVDGPFRTLRGTILEARTKGKLYVRLDILGRDTDVEISAESCAPES